MSQEWYINRIEKYCGDKIVRYEYTDIGNGRAWVQCLRASFPDDIFCYKVRIKDKKVLGYVRQNIKEYYGDFHPWIE